MVKTFLDSERAKESVPKELLKFRTFEAEGRGGIDSKTIYNMLQGRIPFSTLQSFNDPFEGRPYAKAAYTDPAEQRNAMLKYFAQIYRENGESPTLSRQHAEVLMKGKSLDELIEQLKNVQIKIFGAKDLMLFCTSSGEALMAPLTWSHYADSHRGLCVHFDTEYAPFIAAWRVHYSKDYPVATVPRTEADEWEPIKKGLLWKCDLWAYEHEYRLVRTGADNLGVRWDGNVAILPPRVVTRVTFGARACQPARDQLMSWAKINAAHLEFWQAQLHDQRYELVFDRIT